MLIVGGGRGKGQGIALAFAEAGADVAVSALTPTGDATKAADMDRVAQQVLEGFGHLDTLVTCVGDSIRKPVVQLPGTATPGMTEDDSRSIVDINLTEAFQGCRALGPHLLARRQGAVVNISGWAPSGAAPGQPRTTRPKLGSCGSPNPWPRSGLLSAYGSTPWPRRSSPIRADVGGGLSATGCRRRQNRPLGRVGRLRHWADLGCGRL